VHGQYHGEQERHGRYWWALRDLFDEARVIMAMVVPTGMSIIICQKKHFFQKKGDEESQGTKQERHANWMVPVSRMPFRFIMVLGPSVNRFRKQVNQPRS
jgi:hypothetical protein